MACRSASTSKGNWSSSRPTSVIRPISARSPSSTLLPSPSSPADRENRQVVLRQVRREVNEWLASSLGSLEVLALDLEDRPDAVGRGLVAASPPSTRAVVGVFDAAEGELLILGAPGREEHAAVRARPGAAHAG